MKDFEQILQDKPSPNEPLKSHHPQYYEKVTQKLKHYKKSNWQIAKDKIAKIAGPAILTLFSGPFNTASILLQVSDKNMNQTLTRKIEMAGVKNQLVREGFMGDNKIYQPFQFKGYHDCLTQMGKEGFRGLYKGNLTGIVLGLINNKIRMELYQGLNKMANFSQQWKSNLLTILTCTVADFITLPLMFCQTRLILQNSTTNFRTYSGIIDIIRNNIRNKKLITGASVLLFKNIVFTYSWYSFFKNPIQSFVFSTFLSHILTYPFMTVIRQLQSNQLGIPMMNQRNENVRLAMKRIWKQLGIRGYYRGFIGYSIIHLFFGLIMVHMNTASGYFNRI